jgi:hypothetical protein
MTRFWNNLHQVTLKGEKLESQITLKVWVAIKARALTNKQNVSK